MKVKKLQNVEKITKTAILEISIVKKIPTFGLQTKIVESHKNSPDQIKLEKLASFCAAHFDVADRSRSPHTMLP